MTAEKMKRKTKTHPTPLTEVLAKRARTATSDEAVVTKAILHGGPELPSALLAQFRSGNFCDVTIEIENDDEAVTRIPAQSNVLSAGSEFFRAALIGAGSLMDSESAEDGGRSLKLKDISASTVYLYR